MRFRDTCVLAFCRLGVAGLAPKAPGTWGTALACLLAPWPVRASENWLPDGFGVMLDDVLAGLWALLCVGVLHWVGLV